MTAVVASPVNDTILRRFTRLKGSGRLAHAYLFIGPKSIGKYETALAVAKLINCTGTADGFCDTCPSCMKINSGNHPDVMTIDRGDAESIKVQQIRDMIGRLQLSSFEAGRKVCIIKNIEDMTPEGSNTLLKTLEEPPRDSLLILTTSVPEENLKTVVSRCQPVLFYPLSNATAKKRLMAESVPDADAAQYLAYFSQGCLGRARSLADEDFVRQKNEIIDNMILGRNNEQYFKKALSDKAETKRFLDVGLCWFRDVLILKMQAGDEYVANFDRIHELKRLEPRYSFSQVEEILDAIVATLRLLGENLNVKIPLVLLREKIWLRS